MPSATFPVCMHIMISMILKVIYCHQNNSREIRMFVDHNMDDRISNRTLALLSNLKRLQCADVCLKHGDCYAFFYNEGSNECALQDATPDLENSTMQTGWRYYIHERLYPDVIDLAEYVGGNGGTFFSDVDVWDGRPITALNLWCTSTVEGIQARYGSEWGPLHGVAASDNDKEQFIMRPTEYVTGIQAKYDRIIFSLLFFTNERDLPLCGGSRTDNVRTLYGKRLVYLSGKDARNINGIQPIWEKY